MCIVKIRVSHALDGDQPEHTIANQERHTYPGLGWCFIFSERDKLDAEQLHVTQYIVWRKNKFFVANNVIGKATVPEFAGRKMDTLSLFKSEWIAFLLVFLIVESHEEITGIH